MKHQILLSVSLAALAAANGLPALADHTEATADIRTTERAQHIDGFGGCGMNGQWVDVYNEKMVDMLWGRDGMRYNIMRIRIAPDESNWNGYTNPVRWARQRGAFIFATPWTPPYRFKTGATQTWGQSSIHGHIRTDSIEAYARWLERYRQHMAQQGAPVDMISIQNECDYDPDYEGCLYSVQEMTQMIGAARKLIDPSCLVMAPECFGWDSHKYNRELVRSAAVRRNTDVWGNHIYGVNDMTYVNYVTGLTGRPMWMTEYIFDEGQTGTWEDACGFASQIDSCLRAGFSAYVYYNMVDHMFGDGTGGGNPAFLSKMAYVMGHYAHFATGKDRVKMVFTAEKGAKPEGSAYLNAAGDTLCLFVLNRSADSVRLKVDLPFECRQAAAVMTNETRSFMRSSLTDRCKGLTSPVVELRPQALYTLIFTRNEENASEPVPEAGQPAIWKTAGETNPLFPTGFCGDPAALSHDGRLYVFATNEQQAFDATDGMEGSDGKRISSLTVMSTADMVNWTWHGIIDLKAVCGGRVAWAAAPSVLARTEDDGLTHFYLYFANSGKGISVVTATSPEGPWTDPLGKDLLTGYTGLEAGIGTAFDSKGAAWMAFGGGKADETDPQAGKACIIRLADSLTATEGETADIPAPYHEGGNRLTLMGGKLVFSYTTGSGARTDWPSYGSSLEAPGEKCVCYLVSGQPLESGSWDYRGTYLANPAEKGYPDSGNRASILKFGSAYYLVYQTGALEQMMGISGRYHNIAAARATVVERSQRISPVEVSAGGTLQLTAARPDAYDRQQAESLCNTWGTRPETDGAAVSTAYLKTTTGKAWTMVKGVQFGNDGTATLKMRLRGKGQFSVCTDSLGAQPLAALAFDESGWATLEAECGQNVTGVHDLYFMIESKEGVEFDSWQFTQKKGTGVNETGMAGHGTVTEEEYYLMSGVRVGEKPDKGPFIVKTRYEDGTTVTRTINTMD